MKKRLWLTALLLVFFATASLAADLSILRAQIEKVIPQARGEVGVAIKHLESGSEILVNADTRFPMASAYKLPILVELFYQRAVGKVSLDDLVNVELGDLHLGSGMMSQLFDPPGVRLNIRNLINLMMRISDNSATDILLNRVGSANVTARMRSLGLDNIRVDRTTQELIMDLSGIDYARYGTLPLRDIQKMMRELDEETRARANEQARQLEKDLASPRDMNRLLEKLFRGEVVDRATSDEIIEILKTCQTGQNRIRGLLPSDAVVAHKTGTIGGTFNDTGIVYLPHNAGHMAITVFMKNAKAPSEPAERVIAEIARYAYDYFLFTQKLP